MTTSPSSPKPVDNYTKPSNGKDTLKAEALIQYALQILGQAGFATVSFTETGEVARAEVYED